MQWTGIIRMYNGTLDLSKGTIAVASVPALRGCPARCLGETEFAGGERTPGRQYGSHRHADAAVPPAVFPQVGARLEEVNREGMAQRMRVDGFADAGAKARLSAGMLDGVRG